MVNENEDIWKIIIQSDECPFCTPTFKADDDYICMHTKNVGKECVEGLCPAASQCAARP